MAATAQTSMLGMTLCIPLLALIAGCPMDPPWHPERELHLKLRILDENGLPIRRAEVWIDDGSAVSVERVMPDGYGARLDNGVWNKVLYDRDPLHSPGEIPWERGYARNQPLPKFLRILVIRDGKVAAIVRRPLTPADNKVGPGQRRVETIRLNGGPEGTTPR